MPKQLYIMFRSDFNFFQTIFGPFLFILGLFWGVVSILSATVNNKVIRLRPPSLPTDCSILIRDNMNNQNCVLQTFNNIQYNSIMSIGGTAETPTILKIRSPGLKI